MPHAGVPYAVYKEGAAIKAAREPQTVFRETGSTLILLEVAEHENQTLSDQPGSG